MQVRFTGTEQSGETEAMDVSVVVVVADLAAMAELPERMRSQQTAAEVAAPAAMDKIAWITPEELAGAQFPVAISTLEAELAVVVTARLSSDRCLAGMMAKMHRVPAAAGAAGKPGGRWEFYSLVADREARAITGVVVVAVATTKGMEEREALAAAVAPVSMLRPAMVVRASVATAEMEVSLEAAAWEREAYFPADPEPEEYSAVAVHARTAEAVARWAEQFSMTAEPSRLPTVPSIAITRPAALAARAEMKTVQPTTVATPEQRFFPCTAA